MATYQQTFPGGEERIQGHLKIFRALMKKLVMFVEWLSSIGKYREFVLSGQRIAPTGIGKRFDYVWPNGIYKRFVSMVALLV